MKVVSFSRGRRLALFLTMAAAALMTTSSAFAVSGGVSSVSGLSGANGWKTSPVTVTYQFHANGSSPSYPTNHEFMETMTCGSDDGSPVTSYGNGTGTTFMQGSVTLTQDGIWDTFCNGSGEGRNWISATGCGAFGFFPCIGPWHTIGFGGQANGIKIDKTPPVGVQALHATANANGWHNAPSSVSFTGTDPTSLIMFCRSGSPFGLGGPGQSIGPPDGFKFISGGCQNGAGLITGVTVFYNYDATAPTLAPTVGPNPVLRGAAATASPNPGSDLSGIAPGDASCDPVDTSTPGTHTVGCTATDRAGNTTTAQASYDVVLGFTGFAAPVDNAIVNVAKAGQTVPLKFHVSDANGPVTDLSSVDVTVAGLACDLGDTSDQLEEYASGGSGLQNKGGGDYQFNWKTPKEYASSCKTLSVDVGDGADHTAEFRFTK
jgi:hypothetical protein